RIDPLGKFELEYPIHTSTPILFEFLTTPPGLSEWFCDDVNIRDGIYSFNWEGVNQKARLIKLVEDSMVRYQWLDKKDNTYFEFRIERDDLTNDISLIVVDFADTPEDRNSSTLLWNSQIEKLLHRLGSF
ncbi:MAG: START-like domain-containing protein, partial [Bacteroidia bacterium]